MKNTPGHHKRALLVVVGAVITLAPSLSAQVAFTELPPLPGDVDAFATAVSRDGHVVVGWSSGLVEQAVRWTASGVEPLGPVINGTFNRPYYRAFAVNDDGNVIVGQVGDALAGQTHAFRWVKGEGSTDLGWFNPPNPNNYVQARADCVSGDGWTVVGYSFDRGFVWTPERMLQPLVGEAFAVNRNGLVIAGVTSGEQNAYRLENGVFEPIGNMIPRGISDDGGVIVGRGNVHEPYGALRWTRETGAVRLATPPSPDTGAYAINSDGSRIVGYFTNPEGTVALAGLWRDGATAIDLGAVLLDQGISLHGISLWVAEGISADGLLICGTGYRNSRACAWAIRLGPSCATADFDRDGDVGTDADIEAFFRCLGGNCCQACYSADFNGDGDVGTDADIESFFRVLAGGAC